MHCGVTNWHAYERVYVSVSIYEPLELSSAASHMHNFN